MQRRGETREHSSDTSSRQRFGEELFAFIQNETLSAPKEPDHAVSLGARFDAQMLASAGLVHDSRGLEPPRAVRVGWILPSPMDPKARELGYISVETDSSQTVYGAIVDESGRTQRVRKLVVPADEAWLSHAEEVELHKRHPLQYAERIKKAARWLLGAVELPQGHPVAATDEDLAYVHTLLHPDTSPLPDEY